MLVELGVILETSGAIHTKWPTYHVLEVQIEAALDIVETALSDDAHLGSARISGAAVLGQNVAPVRDHFLAGRVNLPRRVVEEFANLRHHPRMDSVLIPHHQDAVLVQTIFERLLFLLSQIVERQIVHARRQHDFCAQLGALAELGGKRHDAEG